MSTQQQSIGLRQRKWNGFIIAVLLLHIPFYFYPLLRLASWLDLHWLVTSIVVLPIASSQIVARLYLRGHQAPWAIQYRKLADFWLGLSPIVLMLLLVFELLVGVTPLTPKHAAVWVLALSLAIGFGGFLSALKPFVKTINLKSKRLKQPLRFVQITDVHIGSRSPRFLTNIMCQVNRLEPDFLCITGDFIDAVGIGEDQLQALKQVNYPIYYCIGNHEKYEDFEEIMARLERLGVNVLRDRAMPHRDDVQILGIDDMEDQQQVAKQLPNISLVPDAFKVLLYHRPNGLEAARDHGIDLMLSGHTHNGQIFPFNFAVRSVFDRIKGMYQLDESRLYVSQGTGTWGPVMRIGTRAEITLFQYQNE